MSTKLGKPKHMAKITLNDVLANPIWVNTYDEVNYDEEYERPVLSRTANVTREILRMYSPIITCKVEGHGGMDEKQMAWDGRGKGVEDSGDARCHSQNSRPERRPIHFETCHRRCKENGLTCKGMQRTREGKTCGFRGGGGVLNVSEFLPRSLHSSVERSRGGREWCIRRVQSRGGCLCGKCLAALPRAGALV